MKLYDEFGNYVGEFIENTKEQVSDSFDISFGTGCLVILGILAFKFPWLILVIIVWLLFKLLWIILKFVFRTLWWCLGLTALSIWWILRLPFTLIFQHKFPDWWFPVW